MLNKELKKVISLLSKVKTQNAATVTIEHGVAEVTNGVFAVRVDVDFKGRGSIEFADLKKVSQALPSGADVDLSFTEGKVCISIDGVEKFSFRDYGEVCKDWEPNEHTSAKISGAQIVQAKKFVCKDHVRPAMEGVLVDGANIVATDAHQLCYFSHSSEVTRPFIIANEALAAIDANSVYGVSYFVLRASFGNATEVKRVHLVAVDHEIIFEPIDGRFPDYKWVIPTDFEYTATFNRKELLAELKLAVLAANPSTNVCALKLENGAATLTAVDIDVKSSFNSSVKVEHEGNVRLGFHGGMMLKILNDIETETVTFKTNGEFKPMAINGSYLQMPSKIEG